MNEVDFHRGRKARESGEKSSSHKRETTSYSHVAKPHMTQAAITFMLMLVDKTYNMQF